MTAGLVVALLGAAGLVLAAFGSPRPLAVAAFAPGDGTAEVTTGAQVVVTLSRPIDPDTASDALVVSPYVEGFVSAAGRRLAFTPTAGFRADTEYTITLSTRVRDRGGRTLAAPVVTRFTTRPQSLVLRLADGRLATARQVADALGPATPLADGAGEVFAAGGAGELAYVVAGHVVVTDDRGLVRHRVALPADARLLSLEWAAGGAALVGLTRFERGGTVAVQIRLDVTPKAALALGDGIGPAERYGGVEGAKLRLARGTRRGETMALTPDGQSVIVRDASLAFAALGLDGIRRRSYGAFLGVGGVSPSGEAVVFVDLDPADPALARQVILYERTGRLRLLSAKGRDSHDPVFASRRERVVFAAGPADGPLNARRYALEILDLVSGVQRRLTSPPLGFTDGEPRVSPDDAWVLFRRWPVGHPEAASALLVAADGTMAARPLGEGIVDARWQP